MVTPRLMDYDGPRYLKGRLLTQKKNHQSNSIKHNWSIMFPCLWLVLAYLWYWKGPPEWIHVYIYISIPRNLKGLGVGCWQVKEHLAWVVPIRPRWQVGKTVWRFLGTIKDRFKGQTQGFASYKVRISSSSAIELSTRALKLLYLKRIQSTDNFGKCHDGWGWKSSHIMWPCACLGELDGWHS